MAQWIESNRVSHMDASDLVRDRTATRWSSTDPGDHYGGGVVRDDDRVVCAPVKTHTDSVV